MPGVQAGDPVITNGDPISSISWGTTNGQQSGYDFIAAQPLPPPFDLPGPIPYFALGTFQHRNFTVGQPWLVSAELDVVLVEEGRKHASERDAASRGQHHPGR